MEKHRKLYKNNNLKYQLHCGLIKLNYLIDHILYQIFMIILIIFSKNMIQWADIPLIRIYVNKIENRTTSKIKTGIISNF